MGNPSEPSTDNKLHVTRNACNPNILLSISWLFVDFQSPHVVYWWCSIWNVLITIKWRFAIKLNTKYGSYNMLESIELPSKCTASNLKLLNLVNIPQVPLVLYWCFGIKKCQWYNLQ